MTNTHQIPSGVIYNYSNYSIIETAALTFGLRLFEERHLCIIAVPTASPRLQLLQSFARLPCRGSDSSFQERYVCHRSGLRWAGITPQR